MMMMMYQENLNNVVTEKAKFAEIRVLKSRLSLIKSANHGLISI